MHIDQRRKHLQELSSPEGPLVRRVLAVNGGAGGDLRLGVDGFRLCADLSCLMATISDPQH